MLFTALRDLQEKSQMKNRKAQIQKLHPKNMLLTISFRQTDSCSMEREGWEAL